MPAYRELIAGSLPSEPPAAASMEHQRTGRRCGASGLDGASVDRRSDGAALLEAPDDVAGPDALLADGHVEIHSVLVRRAASQVLLLDRLVGEVDLCC